MKNQDQNISEIESVIEAYNQYDLDKLYKILVADENNPCPSSQQEKDKINKDRNDNWILILPDMMKQKSSFVAVGALHLAGETGLLYQLEKLGYKVETVTN